MDKEYTQLPFEQINPFVRYAQILNIYADSFPRWLKSYDCRLFYILKGSGTISVGEHKYPVSHGDVLLWQPGTPYRMRPEKPDSFFTMITINFDFTQNHCGAAYPIPPELVSKFQETDLHEILHFTNTTFMRSHVYLKTVQQLENKLLEIVKEYKTQKNFFTLRINGLLLSVLAYAARSYVLPSQYSTTTSINQVIEYIHTHYMENLSNESIGNALCFHPNYINKLMVLNTGVSLHQYLLNYRIAKAIELLETTAVPISEVAYKIGFRDVSHFSKCFHRKTGHPPKAFRQNRTV